jgi:hypothetical protein
MIFTLHNEPNRRQDNVLRLRTGNPVLLMLMCSDGNFWYFWLAIQNTADRQAQNLFYLLAVFISFSAASQTVRHGRKA